MKKFRIFLLILFIIPCAFFLSACGANEVYIKSIVLSESRDCYIITYSDGTTSTLEIEKTVSVVDMTKIGTTDNVDTYKLTKSDGTFTYISIVNGKDGKNGLNGQDGKSLTLADVKSYCEENNLDFDEFVSAHLTVDQTIINRYETTNNYTDANLYQSASYKALHSTVSVWAEHPVSETRYASTTYDTSVSCGAGVIYKMEDEYSYILTNYHVVYLVKSDLDSKISNSIHLFQYGGNEGISKSSTVKNGNYPSVSYGYGAIDCEYIGGSMEQDIAVLKAKTADLKKYFPTAKQAEVETKYSIGENVVAIGNPECSGTSVTNGIVSKYSENITMTGPDNETTVTFRVLRTSAAVNGGNSGGGLFNLDGKLIGIVNAKIADEEVDCIAYALPMENVQIVADQLIESYVENGKIASVKKLVLNITYTTTNNHAVDDTENGSYTLYSSIVVEEVATGKMGERLGLIKGDIISSLTITRDGVSTTYDFSIDYQLSNMLMQIKAGDTICLKGTRNNAEITFNSVEITDSDFTTLK